MVVFLGVRSLRTQLDARAKNLRGGAPDEGLPSYITTWANGWRKSGFGLEYFDAVPSCLTVLGTSSGGGVVCAAIWYAY
jgi:hypothetical protein